jgi:hypothetical protein
MERKQAVVNNPSSIEARAKLANGSVQDSESDNDLKNQTVSNSSANINFNGLVNDSDSGEIVEDFKEHTCPLEDDGFYRHHNKNHLRAIIAREGELGRIVDMDTAVDIHQEIIYAMPFPYNNACVYGDRCFLSDIMIVPQFIEHAVTAEDNLFYKGHKLSHLKSIIRRENFFGYEVDLDSAIHIHDDIKYDINILGEFNCQYGSMCIQPGIVPTNGQFIEHAGGDPEVKHQIEEDGKYIWIPVATPVVENNVPSWLSLGIEKITGLSKTTKILVLLLTAGALIALALYLGSRKTLTFEEEANVTGDTELGEDCPWIKIGKKCQYVNCTLQPCRDIKPTSIVQQSFEPPALANDFYSEGRGKKSAKHTGELGPARQTDKQRFEPNQEAKERAKQREVKDEDFSVGAKKDRKRIYIRYDIDEMLKALSKGIAIQCAYRVNGAISFISITNKAMYLKYKNLYPDLHPVVNPKNYKSLPEGLVTSVLHTNYSWFPTLKALDHRLCIYPIQRKAILEAVAEKEIFPGKIVIDWLDDYVHIAPDFILGVSEQDYNWDGNKQAAPNTRPAFQDRYGETGYEMKELSYEKFHQLGLSSGFYAPKGSWIAELQEQKFKPEAHPALSEVQDFQKCLVEFYENKYMISGTKKFY